MELATISLVLSLVLFIWLSVISFVVFRIYRQFSQLTDKVRGENLIKIIEQVLNEEMKHSETLEKINKEIVYMHKESEEYIQKMGVVRFNPFTDTGGEQSFTLGLLDKRDNGVILTGLHTRERTRVYVKPVSGGKSKIDLSKEEAQALQLAIKNNHE